MFTICQNITIIIKSMCKGEYSGALGIQFANSGKYVFI